MSGRGPDGADTDRDVRRDVGSASPDEDGIALRAGEAMRMLLAALPPTQPWSGRPAPAFRPLPPA